MRQTDRRPASLQAAGQAAASYHDRILRTPAGGQIILTPAQREAADQLSLADREHGKYRGYTVIQWLECHHAMPEILGRGCILIEAWGMTIGIEPDGYTHS